MSAHCLDCGDFFVLQEEGYVCRSCQAARIARTRAAELAARFPFGICDRCLEWVRVDGTRLLEHPGFATETAARRHAAKCWSFYDRVDRAEVAGVSIAEIDEPVRAAPATEFMTSRVPGRWGKTERKSGRFSRRR